MNGLDPQSPLALLDCADMARADAAAIAAGISGEALMEAAGRAVAEEALAGSSPRRAIVLAGPGNNGGDGFVAARHLHAAGVETRLALFGDRSTLQGDAALMAARFGGAILPFDPACLAGADLIVDAIFGAGLARDVGGPAATMIEAANAMPARRLAVDLPSGISGDDGQIHGIAFRADLSVAFFRKKPGHTLVPGRFYCGRIAVRQIGIPASVLAAIRPRAFENDPALWRQLLPCPDPAGHKYQRGHALVISGAPPMLGAARLAAMAALRTGAGVVSMAVAREGHAIQATALTEIMVAPLDREEDLAVLLADPRRNAVAIGPGAGADAATRRRVLAVLAAGRRTVLDADALTAFADNPGRLFAAIAGREVVMTPHGGEFARLFGESSGRGKLEATRQAAAQAGAVIVHKGPDSVIAAPDGTALIETGAPPTLATAGSGDVLTGIILGLLAQGMPTLEAAACAVHLHAGAARRFGPGLIAGDLVSNLPAALAALDRQA